MNARVVAIGAGWAVAMTVVHLSVAPWLPDALAVDWTSQGQPAAKLSYWTELSVVLIAWTAVCGVALNLRGRVSANLMTVGGATITALQSVVWITNWQAGTWSQADRGSGWVMLIPLAVAAGSIIFIPRLSDRRGAHQSYYVRHVRNRFMGAIGFVSGGAALLALLASGYSWLVGAAFAIFILASCLTYSSLTVSVIGGEIVAAVGPLRWPHWRWAARDVESIERAEISVLRWGLGRRLRRGEWGLIVRGGSGVRLRLDDQDSVVLSIPPDGFEPAVRKAALYAEKAPRDQQAL